LDRVVVVNVRFESGRAYVTLANGTTAEFIRGPGYWEGVTLDDLLPFRDFAARRLANLLERVASGHDVEYPVELSTEP
jgi:hypothetical protein